jgi:ribonuclease Z
VDLRAIPLGTSAGRPTLQRGASALAVHCERGWVLCDAGEGAQLAAQRAGLSLTRLEAVLVTHLHGDHFNGLPGLLGTLGLEGRERPLLVAGPRGLIALLEALASHGALGTGRCPIHLLELDGEGGRIELPEGMDGSFELSFGPLSHRVPTFGFRVALPDRPGHLDVQAALAAGVPSGPLLRELKEGRSVRLADGRVVESAGLVGPVQRGVSVAYTLDTVPCEGAVKLARGTDLLVHESTYEHARAELAHERGHSSALEAAQIAAQAEARALLLTHFSPSVEGEALADEARAAHPRVAAARDGEPIAVEVEGQKSKVES